MNKYTKSSIVGAMDEILQSFKTDNLNTILSALLQKTVHYMHEKEVPSQNQRNLTQREGKQIDKHTITINVSIIQTLFWYLNFSEVLR